VCVCKRTSGLGCQAGANGERGGPPHGDRGCARPRRGCGRGGWRGRLGGAEAVRRRAGGGVLRPSATVREDRRERVSAFRAWHRAEGGRLPCVTRAPDLADLRRERSDPLVLEVDSDHCLLRVLRKLQAG
jgi:hypothetical protein